MKRKIIIRPEHIIGTPNPKMWGIFYEEINHAGDGGLYAELIRNRSFADSRIPENAVEAAGKCRTRLGYEIERKPEGALPGWELFCPEEAAASMDLTTVDPRNPECPEQMRLSVMEPAGGVRAVNKGYWGIPLKKQGYYGFCIVRGRGITSLRVGLMHAGGVEVCSQTIEVTDTFHKVYFDIGCPAEDVNGRFFLEVRQAGTLYVDFVTLFPQDTDGSRPYGFRKDLMDMLRGLHPGFVRFPGGCVVEGFNLSNAIHWKKTRGPIEDRPGHWDLWGYQTTDGLGMPEFCQLAEDLEADLMYVCNCAMSCQCRKPEFDKDIDFWLQNTLDAIEYICGDISTHWGAIRAEDGHPEPYPLKYVEIGNENWGEEYFLRYKIFYTAIKKKYPELTLIANCFVPDAPMDMVDDHYYTVPQTFPAMHDAYEGSGIPVYVGEYACNSEVAYGNLLSAVSDAAFMIRMENRCDRVRIASYAPLFCNDHDRRWPVNLINFDGVRVFGIPSYEVQKVFGACSVDRVIEADCPVLEKADSNLYVTAGLRDSRLIVKLVNFGSRDLDAVISVENDSMTGEEAKLLASAQFTDTNSLLDPHMVQLVDLPMEQENGSVTLHLPAYSFAVLTGRRSSDG